MSQSQGAGNMSAMAPQPASQPDAPAPSMTAGQIPDLLKIGSIASNVQMSVDTDVLDPVVQNSKFIRFQLQNKGILHSHSKIQLGYTSPSEEAYVPLNIGIASLIQRATLRIGTQTISEIDDFANFQCYKSQFMSSESMRERLPYLTGQMMGKRLFYNQEGMSWSSAEPPLADSDANGGGTSGHMSRGLVIDSGRNFESEVGDYASAEPDTDMPPYMELYTTNARNGVYTKAPTWQIALSDLFPFLKTNQLPLYMMKEAIQIELVLNDEASAGRCWVEDGGTAALSVSLDTANTKMFADYIYYPQEMMVSYAAANQNLQFSYVDYRLSKLSFDEATTSQQIRNLGGAGRIITKVLWAFNENDQTAGTSPLINWSAIAPSRTAGIDALPPAAPSLATRDYSNGVATFNIKYNNEFLFPIDVDNNARHFHNVVQAEGLTPYSTREEYSREGTSLSTATIKGAAYDFQGWLGGTAFWNCMRLNKGERVNSRGLELFFTMNALPAKTNNYTLRAYLETIKFTSLSNGFVSSYLA